VRRALVAIVLLGWLVVPAVPASAEVHAEFALGILTVNGDRDGNAIEVECVNGSVRVNDEPPTGGRVRCRIVESIIVRAGDGADRVTLADVGRGAFDILLEIGVFGEAGNDTLIGSSLADRLEGGGGDDELRGGEGSDRLVPGGGDGVIVGGGGRDRVTVSGGGDWALSDRRLARGSPSEELSLRGIESVTIGGDEGDDVVTATAFSGSVELDGGAGDDVLRGGSSRDLLLGGVGNDDLFGGPGNDILKGGKGKDELRGGDGNDQLRGGPGDDGCEGGPGADSELSC
jgi:Ca2+-binding RTX toxin-like protein